MGETSAASGQGANVVGPGASPAKRQRQVHHIAGEAIALEQGSLAVGAYSEEEAVAESSLLAFRLAQQTYALDIAVVDEIIEMVTMAKVPRASDVVEGVINLRGTPVPVLNMREALHLPALPPHLHTPIVIGKITGTTVGLIVDEVIDVISIPTAKITPAGTIFGQSLPDPDFLRGMIFDQGDSILLLEIDQIFGAQTAEVFEQVMALINSDDLAPHPAETVEDADQAPESSDNVEDLADDAQQ